MIVVDEALVRRKGLKYVGFDQQRQASVKLETNRARFRSFYGSDPIVYAAILHDLQITNIPDARVELNLSALKPFFLAIHWLYTYPTESRLSGLFGYCEVTCRKHIWYFTKKLQALKAEKIVWPMEWANNTNDVPKFLLTVDGVHCTVREPSTAEFSKDPAYFSHKHHRAGLDYEIGLSVFTHQVVWVNGPFPAGEHDLTIFKDRGLREMIPEGHWSIADNGYRGLLAKIRTSSSLDKCAVRALKCRAKARHESFNGKLKNFAAVKERWRHAIEKHKIAFEAVCVICQYQMENGSPLFDV